MNSQRMGAKDGSIHEVKATAHCGYTVLVVFGWIMGDVLENGYAVYEIQHSEFHRSYLYGGSEIEKLLEKYPGITWIPG